MSCYLNLFVVCFQVMDPSFRAPFGNVNRWFLTTVNQPQFKKVLGEVKLCETMAKFDGRSITVINIIHVIEENGYEVQQVLCCMCLTMHKTQSWLFTSD